VPATLSSFVHPHLLRALLTVFPSAVLAAAVLAAEEVSFLLVGSAALWLRSEIITVADTDAVIEPGEKTSFASAKPWPTSPSSRYRR